MISIRAQHAWAVFIGRPFVHRWTSIGVPGGPNDVRWMSIGVPGSPNDVRWISNRILSRMSRRGGHFQYMSRTKKREVF